jgi:cyclic beta-1,2-glucan synthetase
LHVKPVLPAGWDGYSAALELPSGKYEISVSRIDATRGYSVTINGIAIDDPQEGYLLAAS